MDTKSPLVRLKTGMLEKFFLYKLAFTARIGQSTSMGIMLTIAPILGETADIE